MPESDVVRNEKAEKLAEERGRRAQLVDSRLDDHDRRFLALNGSIERLAHSQEKATEKIALNTDKLADVATEIKTNRDVAEAVKEHQAQAAAAQLTRRTLATYMVSAATGVVLAIVAVLGFSGHL